MRVLVVGDMGQLGTELTRCLRAMESEIGPLPDIYTNAHVDGIDRQDVDITDPLSVKAWFEPREPYDLIVNAAALTNVDLCESQESQALKVNALGAYYLAQVANTSNAKYVYVSTDYVFSGVEAGEKVEDDPVCPVSSYGRSKLAGEILSREACERSFVVRTAWLYGYRGSNFVKTMATLAKEHGYIAVVNDQIGNPTSANDLAHCILSLAKGSAYGTYHCVGEGTCSWFEFACEVLDLLDIEATRSPIDSKEYARRFPQSAHRPLFSALDCSKLFREIGVKPRMWQKALAEYIDNGKAMGIFDNE